MRESSIQPPLDRSPKANLTATITSRRAMVIARLLAGIAAVLAAGAGIAIIPALATVNQNVLMVEVWRAVGLLTFAALFALLAARPLASPALWLIVLGNKLALAISGLMLGTDTPGAFEAAAVDGMLVVLLATGFTASTIARREQSRSLQNSESGK